MTLTSLLKSKTPGPAELPPAAGIKSPAPADGKNAQKGFDQFLSEINDAESKQVGPKDRVRGKRKDDGKKINELDAADKKNAERIAPDKKPAAAKEKPQTETAQNERGGRANPAKTAAETKDKTEASEGLTAVAVEAVAAEEVITAQLALILQVPVEQVTQWLAELGLSPLDLTDPQAVVALLQKAFDAASPAMLLKEPGFQTVYEAVSALTAPYKPLAEAVQQPLAVLEGLQVVKDETGKPVVVGAETPAQAEPASQAPLPAEPGTHQTVPAPHQIPDVNTETQEAPSAHSSPYAESARPAEENAADTNDAARQQNQAHNLVQETAPQNDPAVSMAINQAAARSIETAVVSAPAAQAGPPVNAADVMNQVMSYVRSHTGENFAELRITLRPESLGDVTLRVVTQNGIVAAQFIAENQRIKEVLEANFNQLRDVLQQQGVQVSELSVFVRQGDNEERMNQFLRAQQSGRRRIQRAAANAGAESVQPEEAPLADPRDVLLNTVDYRA